VYSRERKKVTFRTYVLLTLTFFSSEKCSILLQSKDSFSNKNINKLSMNAPLNEALARGNVVVFFDISIAGKFIYIYIYIYVCIST
jgi:hypothetical protein